MAKSSRHAKPRRSAPARDAAAAPPPAPTLSTAALVALALALMTIAVYAQTGSHQLISLDDPGYITNNPHVRTGLTWDNVRWAFTSGYAGNWHPLTWISLQLDVSLFGVTPGALHLVNMAWHVVGVLLLFGLLRAMTGALWPSAFVAATFAVHPTHVESVAWAAERKDVLSAGFWFAATWAYVAWTRRPAAWRYALLISLFALGLMAKPMLVTLPFTLLLLDGWPLDRARRSWARRIGEKLPLFAMSIASSVVTAIVQRGAAATFALVPLPDRLANAVLSYGRYVANLVWPTSLSVLYPLVKPPADLVLLSAVAVAALTTLSWAARRSQPWLLVGWLWFLGTLVPVIGILQVGVQALADRYTYIPSIGLFIAVAWTARTLASRARIPPAVLGAAGAAVIAAFAVAAHAQAATWATSTTLWRQAVTATPNNPRALIELGVAYGGTGRPADASAVLEQALTLPLGDAEAKDLFPNLAQALLDQGRVADALPHLERAHQLNPERADVCHKLAAAYLSAGRTADAIAAWRDAVRLTPDFDEAWFTLGVVLAANGRTEEARQAFTAVLRINPTSQDAQQALAMLNRR